MPFCDRLKRMKADPKHTTPEGILEAALYVDDLDAAERFYGEILAP